MRCITGNVVSGLPSLAFEGQAAIINISASNKKKKKATGKTCKLGRTEQESCICAAAATF